MVRKNALKKKPKKPTIFSKKATGVVLLSIVLIATTLLAYSRHAQYQDAKKFKQAQSQKTQVFNAMVDSLGNVYKKEEKNVCFQSEQGPYDNGKLWCQVSSAAYFQRPIPEAEMKDIYEKIVTQDQMNQKYFQSDTSREKAQKNQKKKICTIETWNGVDASTTPYFFSDIDSSKTTIVVKCADRAKAKHYPFVD